MEKENIKDYALKHSAAHVLALAVKSLYPKVKVAIGPPIEDGFYYDFDNLKISNEDLPKIEKKMKELIKKDLKFKKSEMSREQAKKLLKNEPYKQDILKKAKGKITFYKLDNFTDLCEGNHLKSTKEIKAIKLTKLAGAYWRGDSNNKMLTRIYGVAFKTEKELKDYLKFLELAKKHDHVKIGKELDLFSTHPEGPGFPFWHPRGTILFNKILHYLEQENKKRGYNTIITPILLNESLWHSSGHYENFKEDMFFTKIEKNTYAVKPMNCPGGLLIYKTRLHSYREFPLRNAEFGLVHRNELSGVLHGLLRVRSFTQDDGHVFCTPEQIEQEVISMIDHIIAVYKTFGFKDIEVALSTKPEKSIGSDIDWEIATNALHAALKKKKIKYNINKGEGAFYGPKVDFNIKDSLHRSWQCGTIQADFSMPKRFNITYESQKNTKETPIMIHRAIVGSLERFIGVLIEHYAGKFPTWLNPSQVKVLTVTDRNIKFAEEILNKLKEQNIIAELDAKPHSIGRKVREAQLEQFNYIITIGDKEQKSKTLAIRTREGKVKFNIKITDFINQIKKEIENKQ